jgi:uncharacterized protein involved in copper resistance
MKEKFVLAFASFIENTIKIILSLTLSFLVQGEGVEGDLVKGEVNCAAFEMISSYFDLQLTFSSTFRSSSASWACFYR